jgi:hypothetical protein
MASISSKFITKAGALLRQVASNLDNVDNKCNNVYAAQGLLQELLKLVQHEETRSKREKDASLPTRQGKHDQPPKAKTGPPSEKQGARQGHTVNASQRTEAAPPNLAHSNWSQVAKRGNQARPGNVKLQAKPKAPKSAAKKSFQKPQCEEPIVRLKITKESEWKPRVSKTPAELVGEIEKRVGKPTANKIRGIKVYEGGDVKVFPHPQMAKSSKKRGAGSKNGLDPRDRHNESTNWLSGDYRWAWTQKRWPTSSKEQIASTSKGCN